MITAATRDELLRWLKDPLVCSINPAEVAFNVGIGSSRFIFKFRGRTVSNSEVRSEVGAA